MAPAVEAESTSVDEEEVEDSPAVSAVKSFVEELSGETEPAAVNPPVSDDLTPEETATPP